MTQDYDQTSAAEAAAMKAKVEQLDRVMSLAVATNSLGFRFTAMFYTIVGILLAAFTTFATVLWNNLSGVDQTTTDLKTEVAALRAALGETPDQLVRFLEDLEEVGRDLDRQVRQIEHNQSGLFRAAGTVESRTALWQNYMRDIKSDLEALKRELLPPEKQVPTRGTTTE